MIPFKSQGIGRSMQPQILCAMNLAAGQSDESGNLKFSLILDKAKQIWDNAPQPVKSFPWNKALDNFIQLILDLVLAVIKYLSIPLFALSCVSELSYCAHERKLYFTPVPFIVGAAVTGIVKSAVEEASPSLKNARVPWHLVAVAIFFTLLKLPGPYYPYWGRLFIPHLANGALFRALWFAFLWYRRPQRPEMTVAAASTAENTQDKL
ncbi:OLC1v1003054C2 [Oldenlandia corymbosa var. corymbosa]|nr:OLC1v1003054C2 [Oldenlandia corymbosa var. corymbosa]